MNDRFTPRWTPYKNGPTRQCEWSAENPVWSDFDLRLRLAELRDKAELAALAWYDAGMPYHTVHRAPAGAGATLTVFHAGIKRLYRELRRRARQRRANA